VAAFNSPSDEHLLIQLKDDNSAAFELLYNRYWKRCLNLAELKTGDLMEAENIVQDVFVSLWTRRFTLEINGPFENYLFVSIKYRVYKVLAKKEIGRTENLDSVGEFVDNSTADFLAFSELRRRLEAAVSALPETSRIVYRLNKEDGKSYKEIADETGMSENAVNGHLVRAKKSLRSALTSYLPMFLL
jgi:RNA polymerase sigma-70 factor (family 1)